MTIYAKLTGNRRNTNTMYPKALLTDIVGFERNHMWVTINESISNIQPAGHHKPIYVEITGIPKKYLKQGTISAVSISVKSIVKITKKQYKQKVAFYKSDVLEKQ